MRSAMAYLASAVAAAIVASALVAVGMCLTMSGPDKPYLQMFFVFSAFGFFVAFAHTLLLGIPYALLLKRFRRFRLVPMMIGGFVASILPNIVFLLWSLVAYYVATRQFASWYGFANGWSLSAAVLGNSVLGALAAAVFYGVCRRLLPAEMSVAVRDTETDPA